MKSTLVLLAACAVACAARPERDLQTWDDSSSSLGTPFHEMDIPVGDGLDERGYEAKLKGVTNLERLLLKLVWKALGVVDEAKVLVRRGNQTTAESERLHDLESKLTWLLREVCRVVYAAAKVAFGGAEYSGYQFADGFHTGGRRVEGMLTGPLQYAPIYMPYWPSPWPAPLYFPPLDEEYAEAKLHALHALLEGLKGLDFKAIKLLKGIKEALKVVLALRETDYSFSSSSSSSASTPLSGRVARVLASLAKAEKELGVVLKEQIRYVLKLKGIAFVHPLMPSASPTPSASPSSSSSATATASASGSASATGSATGSATASATGSATATASASASASASGEPEEEEEEEEGDDDRRR